jgi:hypothetical protein
MDFQYNEKFLNLLSTAYHEGTEAVSDRRVITLQRSMAKAPKEHNYESPYTKRETFAKPDDNTLVQNCNELYTDSGLSIRKDQVKFFCQYNTENAFALRHNYFLPIMRWASENNGF